MNETLKLAICREEALIVMRKFYFMPNIEFDELVNIGYEHIDKDEIGPAKQQTYLWMLNFVTKPMNKPDTRNRPSYYNPVNLTDSKLDIHAAINQLDEAAKQLIMNHYYLGQPLADIANNQGVHQRTIQYRIKNIIDRLRALLSEPSKAQESSG